LPRRPGTARLWAADLQQLQAECLELVDDAVEGGLIGERPDEQGVVAASASGQGRERLHDRLADRPADADLVALRATGRSVLVGHAVRVGVQWASPHRIIRMNPLVWLSTHRVQPCPS
jgi:hypothetical protein